MLFTYVPVHATGTDQQVDEIISLGQEPAGIVFEIVSGDDDGLSWALPRVEGYIARLRKAYPQLEMAIVTHGREQFALQTSKQTEHKNVHDSVQRLSTQSDVPVHICQTFAGWRGIEAEAFPEYVVVSATGPQQVNDYKALGYTLIMIKKR